MRIKFVELAKNPPPWSGSVALIINKKLQKIFFYIGNNLFEINKRAANNIKIPCTPCKGIKIATHTLSGMRPGRVACLLSIKAPKAPKKKERKCSVACNNNTRKFHLPLSSSLLRHLAVGTPAPAQLRLCSRVFPCVWLCALEAQLQAFATELNLSSMSFLEKDSLLPIPGHNANIRVFLTFFFNKGEPFWKALKMQPASKSAGDGNGMGFKATCWWFVGP